METASNSELLVAEAKSNNRLHSLLSAVGADFRLCPLEELIANGNGQQSRHNVLILSEEHLIAASKVAAARSESLRGLFSTYRKVLIFPFSASAESLKVLSDLTHTHLRSVNAAGEYAVQDSRGMCGSFSGLRFGTVNGTYDHPFIPAEGEVADFIASAGGAGLFVRFKLGESELFVNSSSRIFDVTAEYTKNLQAADCFSSLVPLMMFLHHAGVSLPRAARSWANWIIDDPNLTPRYGFIKMQELAECIRRVGAALTIAFIPWNYKRTNAKVVKIFRSESPHLSICFHGCDHTGSEFATTTDTEALQLSVLAGSRMRQFESNTSLHCENVMVFPQGRFSHMAMCGLRRSEFLGAVNTELVDSRTGKGVTGKDLLQPAITFYGGFPLFMRRPAEEPIVNFALDLFLGKPCLIVTHHQYFKSGMESLTRKVESLNKLDPAMTWMSLGKGIRSTYTVQRTSDGTATLRLFGALADVILEGSATKVLVNKSEPLGGKGAEVLWNGGEIAASEQNGEILFQGAGTGSAHLKLEIRLVPQAAPGLLDQSSKSQMKIAVRRYLSEFRDNYVDRSPRLKKGVASIRSAIG